MTLAGAWALRGTAYHAPTPLGLEILADVVIAVDGAGCITAVESATTPEGVAAWEQAATQIRLSPDERLLPGFVDLHIHAPQWPQLGTGLDLGLEDWLFTHTFPLEARYADTALAREVWAHMVPTLLSLGTTTAVYYATVHTAATTALAAQCVASGQRAFVGRVAMDHPTGTPEWYRDADARTGLEASAASVAEIRALGSGLVQPILTPRFVPACTVELLEGLGALAAQTGAAVQTHCSESDWEHEYVLAHHGRRDAQLLADCGLIRPGTVLAHGTHLDVADEQIIAMARAGVAHCPLSNAYFANAVFPAARALRNGVRVGLGSDVAGGSAASMATQAVWATTVSRMRADGVDAARPAEDRGIPDSTIDLATAFHLATAGGAAVLDIPVGRFEVGAIFDAVRVDVERSPNGMRFWEFVDSEERLWEKILRTMGAAEITGVWVEGRQQI